MEKNPENCPKTYLTASIITAIFCCWPLSIPAIIYASRVEEYFYDGNYEAAVEASNTAKNWVIASVLTLIIPVILTSLVVFIVAILQGL